MIKVYIKDFHEGERSEKFSLAVFAYYYGIESPTILRGKHGKPYLDGKNLHFSLSHSGGVIFLAVAEQELGMDAERIDREVNYLPILKRYPALLELHIENTEEFLRAWTKVESNVKRIGGSLAVYGKKIKCVNGEIALGEASPVWCESKCVEGFFVSVCAKIPDEIAFLRL